jgi:hypothetical protein
MQQPVLLSPKFEAKSSHIFAQSRSVIVVYGLECLACQDELFVNNLFAVEENLEHALEFVLHLSLLFQSALSRAWHSVTRVRIMISSSNDCLIIAGVSVAFVPRFVQNVMHTRCRIHREMSSGQIHNSK